MAHTKRGLSYEDVFNNCENRPYGACSSPEDCALFLPQNRIKSLIQSDRVVSTLRQNIPGIDSREVQIVADYVTTDAKQVFLTLVYSGTVKHIRGLQSKGFVDKHLPIRIEYDASDPPRILGRDSNTPLHCFADWCLREVNSFCQEQWIFLAPVFRQDKFAYKFEKGHRLPLMPADEPGAGLGNFGTVQRFKLHSAHCQQVPSSRGGIHDNTDEPLDVAVKRLIRNDHQTDKLYQRETNALETMKKLNNNHLIKAIATYTKGNNKYIVFPWANGGNLQHMMETDQRKLDEGLANWVLLQIAGLSDGIRALHSKKIRHGDVKPSNILCFNYDPRMSGNTILKIADVGLAKLHEIHTCDRTNATTTKHGSIAYEPPEVYAKKTNVILSRRYDTWSLGCVFLEIIIWAIYGVEGFTLFHEQLSQDLSYHRCRKDDSPKRHPTVCIWIQRLKSDITSDSAFRELTQLIDAKLLVRVTERVYSETLCYELEEIKRRAAANSAYLFNSEMERLAANRKSTICSVTANHATKRQSRNKRRILFLLTALIVANRKLFDAEKNVGITLGFNVSEVLIAYSLTLNSTWRNMRDNGQAQSLISKLEWSPQSSAEHISSMCQSHRILKFDSPKLKMHLSIRGLEYDSNKCTLCRFLLLCLKRAKMCDGKSVDLFRDDASCTLRSLSRGLPIISIYSIPGSGFAPSYAQVGLPRLAEPASLQQFSLLNEWIELCNQNHSCFPDTSDTYQPGCMPTRVIDVRQLRLVEISKRTKHKYIALSHCWGKLKLEEKFCTTSHNIEILKKNIPLKSLPKSFQDAVTVTRALRISYLWIDSLCIIQDDTKDWESEASKMGDVFNSAYCTIAASSAASSLDGFLGVRSPRACVTVQTTRGPLQLAEFIDNFHAHVEQSVLSTRGWVLQERALSRRTIYFTSTQVYWECGGGVCCETLAGLRNPKSQFLGDSNFPASGLKYYKDDRIRLIQHIYQIYSKLHLTNATDRPKAIIGLQKRLASTFGSRAEYGLHEKYLHRTLLWEAAVSGSLSRISFKGNNCVPSWSWMACTGGIQFMNIPFNQVNWTGNVQNPFVTASPNAQWDGRLHAEASQLLIDGIELSKRSIIDSDYNVFDPVNWKCIVVGISKVASEEDKPAHYALLIRSVSHTSPIYERVGVGTLLADHISPKIERVIVM
ncbi:hypothetical protein TrVGV298_002255 [Trichoderma virens]|nr:hypothetical protein TrVGV298_002255 [Trichoderma virens]